MRVRGRTVFSVLSAIFLLAACGGGGGGGDGGGSGGTGNTGATAEVSSFDEKALATLPAPTPASYRAGTEKIVSEATIGPDGGTLTGAVGTPVEGVVVTVPAGALAASTTLSLGYDENGVFTNLKADEHGPVIVLRSSGATTFPKPLKIEAPFTTAERIPVPYYIREDGKLEVVTPLPFDRASGRAGLLTWHLSNYTFANQYLESPPPLSLGFFPARDGFQESNTSDNQYISKGRCWGMSSFVKWYWTNQGSGLFSKFMTKVPSKLSGEQLTGQRIITVRAHNSVAKYLAENENLILEADTFEIFITQVKDALARTGLPVMISLAKKDGLRHAILAIGYTDNQIAVYDPNWPGMTKAIDYEKTGAETPHYGYWETFQIFGNGELKLNEKYQHLVEDAQADFHGENQAKIEFTSHTPPQKVKTEDISLEGKVYSGQVLVEELEATVMPDFGDAPSGPVTVQIPIEDNTFKIPLQLARGWNAIRLDTRGYLAYKGMDSVENDPTMISLEFAGNDQPLSSILIESTTTDTYPLTRKVEVTTSFSANLSYQLYPWRILSDSFDYTKCADFDNICQLLYADTYDSTDFFTKEPLLVTKEYHQKIYDIDDEGREILMEYTDAKGTLQCNSLQVTATIEEGGTKADHRYRLVVKPGGICFPADQTPMVTGKYKMSRDSSDWYDLDPEPLSLYRGFPYSAQMDKVELSPCEHPLQILPGDIEPWARTQDGMKVWNLNGSIDGCDNSGTKRDETVNVLLRLVPN